MHLVPESSSGFKKNVITSMQEIDVIKTGRSCLIYMSIFHWLEEVLKKPQLAAF